MIEHSFQCPYCWQKISMLLDPSVTAQEYIEDCEVCCNPIRIKVSFKASEMSAFEAGQVD